MGNYQELTRGLSSLGTAGLVIPCEQIGDMPIMNWRQGNWPEGAQAISGQRLKEAFSKGQFRCAGCPVGCGRVIELDGVTGPSSTDAGDPMSGCVKIAFPEIPPSPPFVKGGSEGISRFWVTDAPCKMVRKRLKWDKDHIKSDAS